MGMEEMLMVREVVVRYGEGRRALDTQIIRGPEMVQHLMRDMKDLPYEEFRVIMLNGRHRVMAWYRVSQGTLTSSIVHPREVFGLACQCRAAGIIVCHNHPSGVAYPSSEDMEITGRLAKAGVILGIPILDHVILASDTFHSMKTEGTFPEDSDAQG